MIEPLIDAIKAFLFIMILIAWGSGLVFVTVLNAWYFLLYLFISLFIAFVIDKELDR